MDTDSRTDDIHRAVARYHRDPVFHSLVHLMAGGGNREPAALLVQKFYDALSSIDHTIVSR